MEKEKNVDESWKESAAQEKAQTDSTIFTSSDAAEGNKTEKAFELSFSTYITSLVLQTMIFLGAIPNPATNTVDKNIQQAKLLIDTLLILRDKTQGNLTKEEDDLLSSSIYQLQVQYIEGIKNEQK